MMKTLMCIPFDGINKLFHFLWRLLFLHFILSKKKQIWMFSFIQKLFVSLRKNLSFLLVTKINFSANKLFSFVYFLTLGNLILSENVSSNFFFFQIDSLFWIYKSENEKTKILQQNYCILEIKFYEKNISNYFQNLNK